LVVSIPTIIVLMSHVMAPVRPMTRAIFLAQHAVAIAVVLLDHLGKRALIFLERDLAVPVAVEPGRRAPSGDAAP
jgi:hypothetical protein